MLEVPKGVPVTVDRDRGVACRESGVLLRGVTSDPWLDVLDLWGVLVVVSTEEVSARSLSLNAASFVAVAVFTYKYMIISNSHFYSGCL